MYIYIYIYIYLYIYIHISICIYIYGAPALPPCRFRVRQELERVSGLFLEAKAGFSQGQNLALTALYVPYSLDSGARRKHATPRGATSRKRKENSAPVSTRWTTTVSSKVNLP